MANLTLIEAMTKTADLVYQRVKTLISQSGSGTVNYKYNNGYPVQIGTVDGQKLYRCMSSGTGIGPGTKLADIRPFKEIIKISVRMFFKASDGYIDIARDVSNYVSVNKAKITTTTDYPNNLSDPEAKWNLIFEFTV